jgi:hypothetical protein
MLQGFVNQGFLAFFRPVMVHPGYQLPLKPGSGDIVV